MTRFYAVWSLLRLGCALLYTALCWTSATGHHVLMVLLSGSAPQTRDHDAACHARRHMHGFLVSVRQRVVQQHESANPTAPAACVSKIDGAQ